jgi:NAD(P)-dependent dehydrogenase (short-subunit alcohol dehydrogenase family)
MTSIESAPALAGDVLAGRVLLITGAAGGLGSQLCRQAAAQGAIVILCGRRVRPLEKLYDEIVAIGAATPAIFPIDLEGASPDDYEGLAQSVAKEFGRLDGLVHAAASFAGLISHAQTPPEEWLKSIQVNLNAPVALTQACLPLLGKSDDAALLVILDQPARVGKAHWGAYGIAKIAQHGLVTQWAEELDNSRIRVHGLVPTPMRTKLRARAYFAENPGLIDLPAAVASACVELLSPAGKSWRGRVRDLNLV